MVTIHLPTIGLTTLFISTLDIIGKRFFIIGKDSMNNCIQIFADKFYFADDYVSQYGYIHIVEYTIQGCTTKCNISSSMA